MVCRILIAWPKEQNEGLDDDVAVHFGSILSSDHGSLARVSETSIAKFGVVVSTNLGSLLGVAVLRALLFGVYIREPNTRFAADPNKCAFTSLLA